MNCFRERLLKANQEACELELSRKSKMAILQAWEKNNQEDKDKFTDVIIRLKNDVTEQELNLSQLHELRQKLEKAIRKGDETALSLESRMKTLAKDGHQKELIEFIVKMSNIEAESTLIL